MASFLPSIVGTLVLMMYGYSLINCSVHNFEPVFFEEALISSHGIKLWTVPLEDKSKDYGLHQNKPVLDGSNPHATIKDTPAEANADDSRKGRRTSAAVTNTELPWYILIPFVIVLGTSEVGIMIAVMKREDRMRAEVDDKVFKKIYPKRSAKRKRGKAKNQKKAAETQAKKVA